jgi:Ca-activated chloride channel homolog
MNRAAMRRQEAENGSSGGRLVAVDGRTLPLRGTTIAATARAGLGRVVLTQRFVNPYDEPLAVTYKLPLPADGAVSAFAFVAGGKRMVGEVDRRAAARERYWEAIAEGRTAALLDEERTALFTQELGNIPPRAEIEAEIVVDQKLGWIDGEGAWEWRFPTVAMARYQGAPGRVDDAADLQLDVADGPLPTRAQLELTIGDRLADGQPPRSPSHALTIGDGGAVTLAARQGVALDRDLVVRWTVATPAPGLALDVGRPAAGKPHAARAFGLMTLVPPARTQETATARPMARELCLLIDTSGSMGGEPLAQARRVLGAIVDTLGDGDSLEMIEFSSQARRWQAEPQRVTAKVRAAAQRWLAALKAGGGTEMRTGILEALAPRRADTQRQIVLVSDGAIGFEREIVHEILHRLPASSRLHTVGVGSAVNRSLTEAAARAGRGLEVIVGIGEDPERAAQRLVARTDAPLVVDLTLSGSALVAHAPMRLPDLFAGAPARVALELAAAGGELVASGRTHDGAWEQRIVVAPLAAGEGNGAVVTMFGREAVADLETRLCAGEAAEAIDAAVEKVGLEFQIATRLTSWIAAGDEPAVDPTAPSRKERIPQALPFGVSVEGLGLRASGVSVGHFTGAGVPAAPSMMRSRMVGGIAPAGSGGAPPPPSASGPAKPASLMGKLRGVFESKKLAKEPLLDSAPAPVGVGKVEPVEGSAGAASVTPRRLRGRITLRKGRDWIVEIEVDGELDWAPGSDAVVEGADGLARVHAVVVAAQTTHAGRVQAGQTLRLVLTLDGDLAGARRIEVGGLVIEV